MNPTDEVQRLHQKLQSYLDGTLPRAEAVKLFLHAEKDPKLRAELDSYRELFHLLDHEMLESPSESFDERVLASVPYEKYETAPRKARPVLALGEEAPSVFARLLRPLRSGATAFAAAYVLFLVVSHSFLERTAAQAAAALGEALGKLAAETDSVPVVSFLVGSLAWAYDAVTSAVAALGSALGGGVATIVLGVTVGALTVGVIAMGRRRQEAKRTHA